MNITQELVRELFLYDEITGSFSRKQRDLKWFQNEQYQKVFNTRFANKEIIYKRKGYFHVWLFDKSWAVHRLIFLYVRGYIPEQIDHIDGDPSNNKWDNLRQANYKTNTKNKARDRRNTSGVSGVRKINNTRWIASIGKVYLGSFNSFEEAVQSRKIAEVKYGYHENHGRKNRMGGNIHH